MGYLPDGNLHIGLSTPSLSYKVFDSFLFHPIICRRNTLRINKLLWHISGFTHVPGETSPKAPKTLLFTWNPDSNRCFGWKERFIGSGTERACTKDEKSQWKKDGRNVHRMWNKPILHPKCPISSKKTDNRRNIKSCFGKDTFYNLLQWLLSAKHTYPY